MESRKVRFWAVALAMAFAAPAFAGARDARNDPARAAQQVENARTAIEAARQPQVGATPQSERRQARLLLRAQRELDLANSQLETGTPHSASNHALKASTLVWRATAPQKGGN